jgi:DNA-binding NtrC family response regulator
VLVDGESGTGKELMAKVIHANGSRADKPYISVNCGAIPDTLLESELFGHKKGAFTGAANDRKGKFESAHKGTIFLDEIGELPMGTQAKLLRVLQEREIDRVGGNAPIKVDVRIIATSNRNMEEEVKNKRFREDLYFRLNVMSIRIPSLRDRPLDIKPLCDFFITKFSEANGVPQRSLAANILPMLQAHPWRGNVRELENCIHRAVLMARGDEITEDAVVLSGQTPGGLPMSAAVRMGQSANANYVPGALVGRTVADVERDLIIETLQHCLGNRTHAANILGISIRTLRNKLKEYTDKGIPVPTPGGEAGRAGTGA